MSLATPEALAAMLRRDKELLLAAWEQRARDPVLAAGTPAPVLRDHVPLLLDTLADALARPERADGARLRIPSAAHGVQRARLGADPTGVLEEYRLLRDTITERAEADGMLIAGETARALQRLIDEGIKAAVEACMSQRDEVEARRRNEYLKLIVHDLRSPLSAVYYAILLAEKDLAQAPVPVPERVHEIHAAIRRNVERMRGLIVKLLQEEANLRTPRRVQPRTAALELRPAVEAAARALAPLAAGSETEVINEVSPEVRVRADDELLGRVLQNLLVNAIDRAPKGCVRVDATKAGGHVQCSIRDNGHPLPAGLVEALRAADAAEQGYERARLGLVVAKRLLQAQGGGLDLHNRGDNGAILRFSLPAA